VLGDRSQFRFPPAATTKKYKPSDMPAILMNRGNGQFYIVDRREIWRHPEDLTLLRAQSLQDEAADQQAITHHKLSIRRVVPCQCVTVMASIHTSEASIRRLHGAVRIWTADPRIA
jgi:hypothetical protein